MKKLLIAVGAIVVIVIGVLAYGASQSGSLIKAAVLEYAPKATGADVTLGGVNVSFMSGNAGLTDLTVGNPAGFKSAHAFKVGNMDVKIDLRSLTSDVIHIKQVRINGANLMYEIGTQGNNISKIQKNIEAYTQSLGLAASDESHAKFIVDHIYITGTKVTLATDLLSGKDAGLTLPDIHLKNVGTEDKGATAGEVGIAVFGALNKSLSKVITKDMLKSGVDSVKKKLGDIFK